MKCPKCNKELIGYIHGESYGFGPGYPYESGYYCPNRCVSFSDLELSRGALENYGKDTKKKKISTKWFNPHKKEGK